MHTPICFDDVVQATGADVLNKGCQLFYGVGTDTRLDLTNKLFLALAGETYDAHDFLKEALKKGVKGLLVHRDVPEEIWKGTDISVFRVPDTLKALQDLGHFWRKKSKALVVGITGSNGKTSTKEFARTLLSSDFQVKASPKSFNNHWGVPLTLLDLDPQEDEVVLVEMGMNHSGELQLLSEVAEPNVVVVTTVGHSHVGHLGSLEKVAQAKEEIYLSNKNAIAIFNLDNEYCQKMYERSKNQREKIITFSTYTSGVDVSLRVQSMGLDFIEIVGHIGGVEGQQKLDLFGRQNIVNVMAASAIALAVGLPPEKIWKNLGHLKSFWGRGQKLEVPEVGATIIFDAYNANPESMAALIRNIYELPLRAGGKKVAILGEMLELGEHSARLHEKLGQIVAQSDIETVWFMGPHASDFKRGFDQERQSKNIIISDGYNESLALEVKNMLNKSDVVVVKGSRGMQLERVLKAWNCEQVGL